MNQIYLDTARLLTQVAPLVIADGTFALEGAQVLRWTVTTYNGRSNCRSTGPIGATLEAFDFRPRRV